MSDARPHLAGLVEDHWNLGLTRILVRRGWRHRVVPHTGYGNGEFLRVLARVVLAPPSYHPAEDDAVLLRRGWRNFISAEAMDVPVSVTIGGHLYSVRTDRSGNVDARLPNHGLGPGWGEVTVQAADSAETTAQVRVVRDDVELGLVSDIDDTVLSTFLPRPLLAAYNTFVAREVARRPVQGMAELYAALLAEHPEAPTFYVSTGAWNTAPTLRRFLARHGLPDGPLLLTDWGPTNTGWFRSGRVHKRQCLESLASDFPRIRWVLVGDDGQHDPAIYSEFARDRPEHVRAIAIRELPMTEQVLSHGTPGALPDGEATELPDALSVPEVRGRDGHDIAARLLPLQ